MGREVVSGVEEVVPGDADVCDRSVLAELQPAVQRWWAETFGAYVQENGGFFTPPQREAIPHVAAGDHTLVVAPTGSGKTLAAFTAVLNDLFDRAAGDELDNSVYCLYVSPLRSLANDIHRNLETPLTGIREEFEVDVGEIRHAIRHGDTDDAARRGMLEETPHILNTTPETLAILLNSPKFREKLQTVEYVIVDEIHAVADSKRGTHLSVSLERLESLARTSPTRIGCSATVEPLETVARFLGGYQDDGSPRPVSTVDARFARDYDLELRCPVDDLVGTPRETVRDRFYTALAALIDDHETTLVFTNTRSGAERVLEALRERDAVTEERSGCHHGSMASDRRQAIEEQLKAGTVDVVTTSTSLEVGIDMPDVDLVVQVGSPKSVAALLQRVGRAGHRVGRTVTGRVFALDRDELVECAAMLREAEAGAIDRVFVPERAHDVAAQHVYGMAIAGVRREAAVRSTLERAYPYRAYTDEDWERLCRYLTADHDGLEDRSVYAKIWRDENDPPDSDHHHPEFPVGEPLIGKRGRLARPIYLTNVGTIPDSFACQVVVRDTDEQVGTLDESYLDTLEPGDVFVLAGERLAFRYRRGSKVYVDRTSERATVPTWYAERLPLSYDLGQAVAEFQGDIETWYDRGGKPMVRAALRDLPLDEHAVRALARLFDEQRQYAGAGALSTEDRLVVEQVQDRDRYRRTYYVHSLYGRRVNDALARLVARECAEEVTANVQVAVADNGFAVSMPLNRKVDIPGILAGLDPEAAAGNLRESLSGTDLLQRYFRIEATRSLMILKRYRGHERSASQQQVDSEMLLGYAEDLEDFAVLEETYRELLEDRFHIEGVESVLTRIDSGALEVVWHRFDAPSPRAFGLATLSASDVVLAEDEDAVLQSFHDRVMAAIDGDESTTD
ncbi:MAG: ATP-dependent helicase [Halobacteriaceae archaeon]